MRWLLVLLVGVLAGCDVFDVGLSLGPGLSIKNAVVYLIAVGLFFRTTLSGELRIDLPAINGLFVAWIGYAILSMLAVALLLHYPNYHLSAAVINLKTMLIDPAVFCLTVFYGLRSARDVRLFLKCLAAAICIANVLTIADVAGLVHLQMRIGQAGVEEDRVFGFFGHADETGTLIACMLPLILVHAASGRKAARLLWFGGAFASAIVLIMTVSRGAFVAALVAAVWGAYLGRHYIRLSHFVGWALGALAMIAAVGAVATIIDPQMSGELYARLVGQTSTIDFGTLTSGRSGIWLNAIGTMMDKPLSLVTGYGWNAYESMPFILATHNYYLDLWFDLGLFGLAAFLLIIRKAMRAVQSALPYSSGEQQRYLLAFLFAMIAMLVGVFFTLLFKPWPYIWMYVGAMMRASLVVEPVQVARAARAARVEVQAASAGALAPALMSPRVPPRERPPRVPAGLH
jgi:O-antigen ligase